MAYLLSTGATGNWTSASTWSAADGTNFIDSRAVSTVVTTTPVANTAFSWASSPPTLQGVAVQLSLRAASPSGNITVELYNVTGATSVRSVTIAVSDLSTTYGAAGSMWTYFKFASNVTLATGTNYAIRLSTSVASQVSCYALATTNWSYMLITTTNQAPTTNDSVIITRTHATSGVFSTTTVTMDNTSATQYGNIFISNFGVLDFGTSANTNYKLANNGVAGTVFIIGYGGSLYIARPNSYVFLPASCTVTITLNCASALSTPLLVYGSLYVGGSFNNTSPSAFNKLAADVSAGATGSTVTDSTTAWKSGDQIVVPSTTRTPGQFETITLSADQSGTSLSHSAYVNAHGGNASTLIQADIANITRNIVIKSGSTTFRSNIQIQANAFVQITGVRFQDLGTGVAATTYGICVPTINVVNGSYFNMYYCSMLNTVSNSTTLSGTGLYMQSIGSGGVVYNIFYNLGWTAVGPTCSIPEIGGNMFIGNFSSTYACASTICTGNNNVFASNTATTAAYSGTFYTNSQFNSFYSNSGYGLYFVGSATSTGMSNFSIWRNVTGGLYINSNSTSFPRTLSWDFTSCNIFGNGTYGIFPAALYTKVVFNSCSIYGGSTLVQSIGFFSNGQYIDTIIFQNCQFGYDNGGGASPHTTANLSTPIRQASVQMVSCLFNGTEITGQTPAIQGSNSQSLNFFSINHNGTGLNKQWLLNGTISGDSTYYKTSSPSIRMTPISLTYKLSTATFKVPVKSGTTYTISLYIRKSVAGDGTVYNGSSPRLMWVYNPGIGNMLETICNTPAGGDGAFVQMSYTTPSITNDGVAEFYIDCDGTTGWINIDDIKVTPGADSRGGNFSAPNGIYLEADNKKPGGSYGFVL